jgi:hypothetical protein
MKSRFLYHADAAAATGYMTLPYQELIGVPASASVPLLGGHARASAENFNHRGIISFRKAEIHVVGSYSAEDRAHGTMSSVSIEGVNILDVVTCDRITLRLTSKYPDDGGETSFIPLGSGFENLRIAGHPMPVNLATDLFTTHSTWSSLTQAYERDAAVHDQLAGLSMIKTEGKHLPEGHGILGVTLARNLDRLPGGLERRDHGIYVPHFGTVYLAEYFISRHVQRLLMLHVDLGCSFEGVGGLGCGQNNGSTFP